MCKCLNDENLWSWELLSHGVRSPAILPCYNYSSVNRVHFTLHYRAPKFICANFLSLSDRFMPIQSNSRMTRLFRDTFGSTGGPPESSGAPPPPESQTDAGNAPPPTGGGGRADPVVLDQFMRV